MSGPVLEHMERKCQEIGEGIAAVLEEMGKAHPEMPRTGFALLVYTFGPDGWMTFTSNAGRDSMVSALEELLRKIKEMGGDDEQMH